MFIILYIRYLICPCLLCRHLWKLDNQMTRGVSTLQNPIYKRHTIAMVTRTVNPFFLSVLEKDADWKGKLFLTQHFKWPFSNHEFFFVKVEIFHLTKRSNIPVFVSWPPLSPLCCSGVEHPSFQCTARKRHKFISLPSCKQYAMLDQQQWSHAGFFIVLMCRWRVYNEFGSHSGKTRNFTVLNNRWLGQRRKSK